MNLIKKILLTIFGTVLLVLPSTYIAFAQNNQPSNPSPSCSSPSFFGLEPWYKYLIQPGSCSYCFSIFPGQPLLTSPNSNCANSGSTSSSIPLVLLAIIDDLLRIAGMVAVIYIVISSFRFITSRGNAEGVVKARNSLTFALIGLVISVTAIVIINFIGNNLIH